MSTRQEARSTPKRSIRRKLVAILLITGLTPLLVASIAGTLHTTTALKESIGANFQEIAVQTRDKTDLILRREIADVSRLGHTGLIMKEEVEKANVRYAGKSEPEIFEEMQRLDERWTQGRDDDDLIRQCLESKASSGLNSHLSFEPEKIAEILLTDNQGALVGATGKTSDYYQADEGWWQNAFNDGRGAVYVSLLNYDESTGVISLDISAPVMDEKGERAIGVLKVVVNAGYILNTLRKIHFGRTGQAYLVSSGGNILVDEENLLPDEKVSADILARLDPSRAMWFVGSSQAGREQSSGSAIIGIAPLEIMNQVSPGSFGGERWYVVVAQETGEAFAPVYRLVTTLSLIGGGVVIAIVLLGFWLAGRIARPIRALREGAEQIGDGQWNHRLDIKTGDEFEQLANVFNRMANSLTISHSALAYQIKERTKELRCLYDVAAFIHDSNNTLEDIFQKTADLMTQSWQYPETTCARIIYEGKAFETRDFTETEWKQSSDIIVAGKKVGTVEVYYTEERAELDEGPFLEGERELINALAMKMEKAIEHRHSDDVKKKESAKLSAMISVMEEGVVFADADNTIVEVNDYFCRFVGKDRSEIIGKKIQDFHANKLDKVMRIIAGFRENPGSKPFILQRPLGGAEVILRMQAIYRDNCYEGVLLNVVNVTELVEARRKAEMASAKLAETVQELKQFNQMAVGRELRMVELKQRINELCERCGEKPQYESVLQSERVGLPSDTGKAGV